MAVHIGSVDVIIGIDAARNTDMLQLAQNLNAAKPKLMMRGGRHVFMGGGKIIMIKSHTFLFPPKKRYHVSMNAASILIAANQSCSVTVSRSVTDNV